MLIGAPGRECHIFVVFSLRFGGVSAWYPVAYTSTFIVTVIVCVLSFTLQGIRSGPFLYMKSGDFSSFLAVGLAHDMDGISFGGQISSSVAWLSLCLFAQRT